MPDQCLILEINNKQPEHRRSLLSSTDSYEIPGIQEIPRNEIWLEDQPKLIIPFRRNLEGIEFRQNGSWNFRNGI
jgi:hypothetical protein